MKRILLPFLMILPLVSTAQWSTQATGFADSLRDLQHISVVSDQVAWATAFDGSSASVPVQEFTRTTNGGVTWIPGTVSGVPGYEPTMLFALNADTAWAMYYDPANDGGKIMRTNNGGSSWTHQSTALFADSLEAYPNLVYFWNASEGFAMGDPTNGYFEIYTTSNGGNLWSRVPSGNMPALISGEYGYAGRFSVIGNTVLFGTNKGHLYKSVDRGNNWVAVNTPLFNTGKARVVEFRDTLNGLIADRVNNTYVMYETSDGGNTWQVITPSGPVYGHDLRYVKGTPATYVSTGNKVGYSGASISHDGGHTWTEISSPPGTPYGELGFSDGMIGWAGQLSQGPNNGGVARYKLLSRDASVSLSGQEPSCPGLNDLYCTVSNQGVGLLESVDVHWSLNGIVQPSAIASLSLLPGESSSVLLGSIIISPGMLDLEIHTAMPNAMVDTVNGNDTVHWSGVIPQSPVVDLGPDTSIHAGNTITFDAGAGYMNYLWSTGDSTQVILLDSNGTGLGSVQVSVIVTDSLGCTGTDTVTLSFHVNPGIFHGDDTWQVEVYPVPATDWILIDPGNQFVLKGTSIYDGLGKLMIRREYLHPSETLDIGQLSPGIYYLEVILVQKYFHAGISNGKDSRVIRKIIVME